MDANLTETSVEIRDDDYAEGVPPRLDPDLIRQLSELRPWLSSAHIALEWSLILGAGWLSAHYWHPLSYLAAVILIGGRQHALIVLAHEAAHYRLFKSRNLNDWVGEIALAWPFVAFTMQSYRRNHFPHHRHLNTPEDPDFVRKQTPDWAFPLSALELIRTLAMDVSGMGFLKFITTAAQLPAAPPDGSLRSRAFKIGRRVFLVALAALLTACGAWQEFLLYWVIPYVTWMQLAFHVRSIAEHHAIPKRKGLFTQTRTVHPTLFERVFLVPKNVNYHAEHHLYPSVPFYRLPQLHKLLMEQPHYPQTIHQSPSYLAVLRECVKEPPLVLRPSQRPMRDH